MNDAILDAAEAILLEEGLLALSVNAVVARAGTTRPTFYRRYAGLGEMLLELLGRREPDGPPIDTGSLDSDLREIQRRQVAAFSDPLFRSSLVGLLDAAQRDPALASAFTERVLQTWRRGITDIIGRGVIRGEIPVPDNSGRICEMLLAPLMMRTLVPGLEPVDETLAQETADFALLALGWKPSASTR